VAITYTALTGWTADMAALILAAITAYLGSLQIGETVTRSALFAVAMSITDLYNPAYTIKTVTLATTSTPTATADIVIAFNAVSAAATITVTAV
jgi:hypothetical protein